MIRVVNRISEVMTQKEQVQADLYAALVQLDTNSRRLGHPFELLSELIKQGLEDNGMLILEQARDFYTRFKDQEVCKVFEEDFIIDYENAFGLTPNP